MADTLKFRKGTESKLPSAEDGQVLFTTDTNKLYVDDGSSHKLVAGNAVVDITRNGTTFTMTKLDGTTDTFTQQDNNTTYSAGTGISISNTTINNSGVRSVATGSGNGTISVNTNGTAADVAVKNVIHTGNIGSQSVNYATSAGSANAVAWGNVSGKPSTYPPESHSHSYLPLSGGTLSGALKFSQSLTNVTEPTVVASFISNNSANGIGYSTVDQVRSQMRLSYAPKAYTIDLSSYSTSNFYLVYFLADEIELDCIVKSNGGTSDYAWNQNYIHFIHKDNGWTDSPEWFTVLGQGAYHGGELTIMSIVHGNSAGLKGIYLRGGIVYSIIANQTPSLATSTYTYGNESYASGTTSYTNVTNASVIWTNDGSRKASFSAPLYGAVWNDYAEFRSQDEHIEPGYCVTSSRSGKVSKTVERLQYCEGIVSDTFGFAIGETNECKTPLAVSGRVLAYYDGNIEDYDIGDVVCAGPEGKVCKMSREEIKEYPDRIVGTISEFPSYEFWGDGKAPTKGRIWIKVL